MERVYSEHAALQNWVATFSHDGSILPFLYHWCHMLKSSFRLVSSPYSCVFQFGSVTGYHRPFFLLQLNLPKVKHKTISFKYTYFQRQMLKHSFRTF